MVGSSFTGVHRNTYYLLYDIMLYCCGCTINNTTRQSPLLPSLNLYSLQVCFEARQYCWHTAVLVDTAVVKTALLSSCSPYTTCLPVALSRGSISKCARHRDGRLAAGPAAFRSLAKCCTRVGEVRWTHTRACRATRAQLCWVSRR